jgi:hypothetical protein
MSGKAERVGYSDYAESTDPRDGAMFNRAREEVADVGVAALAGIQAKGPLQGAHSKGALPTADGIGQPRIGAQLVREVEKTGRSATRRGKTKGTFFDRSPQLT